MAVKTPTTRNLVNGDFPVTVDDLPASTAGDTVYSPYQQLFAAFGYTTSGALSWFVCSHVNGVGGAGGIVTIGSGPNAQTCKIIYIGKGA